VTRRLAVLALALAAACGAQTTFNYNAAGVTLGGAWSDAGGFQQAGCGGGGSYVALTMTGTKGEINIWQAFAWTVSVDGAAAVSVTTLGTSVFAYSTLFTGLSDGPHTVLAIGSGAEYLNEVPAFRVTGASPAVSAFAAFASPVLYSGATWSTYGQFGGAPATDSFCSGAKLWAQSGQYGQMGGESSDRVTGVGSASVTIGKWIYNGGAQTMQAFEDGVEIGTPYTASSNGVMAFAVLASGINATGNHTFEIRNIAISGWTLSIGAVFGGITLSPATAWPQIAFAGDSITQGNTNTPPIDATAMDTFQLGAALNIGIRRDGAFGCGVSQSGSDNCPSVAAQFTGATPAFKYVVLAMGVNDATAGSTIGTCGTSATFEGNYITRMNATAALMQAGGTIWLRGILPNNASSTGNVATYRAAEQAIVACFNAAPVNGVNAVYIATDNWIDGTSGSADLVSGSNVHPNAQGYAKIAAREEVVFAFLGPPSTGAGAVVCLGFCSTQRVP
jgi:hypothetical protein